MSESIAKLSTSFGVNKQSEFYAAVHSGNLRATIALSQQEGVNIDATTEDERTAMYVAAERGFSSIIDFLIQSGSKAIDTPDRYGWTPLHVAAWHNHQHVVLMLVQLGCKLDIYDNQTDAPLCVAIVNECDQVVKIFKLLGVTHLREYTVPSSKDIIDYLQTPIPEDESYDLRRKVYFQRSLSTRLIFTY